MNNLFLIKNTRLYAPDDMGMKDVLVSGSKIAMIDDKIDLTGTDVTTWDVEGRIVTPGFMDRHVHVIGGGGQKGFASLAPEVTVSELVACGTTTVVGLLGTDGFVKDLPSLYAKVKGLSQEGLSAYMLTGYYGLPTPTLTDSVAEDLIYIDKVIGCKLAMSDDRSAFPTEQEIMRLVNQVRLGGFTSGKGGFLHIHLGNLPSGISMLIDIAKKYPTLVKYLSPTHMIRTEILFEQAVEFALLGGNVDFSTGGTRFQLPHQCVIEAMKRGVELSKITFSSDGHGGVRRIDPVTGEDTYRPAPLDLNFKEVKTLVNECGMPLRQALKLITQTPARQMYLDNKGEIAVGKDADFCVLDSQLNLTDVVLNGKMAMQNQNVIKKGRYER